MISSWRLSMSRVSKSSNSVYDIPRTPTVEELEQLISHYFIGADAAAVHKAAKDILDTYIVRCK